MPPSNTVRFCRLVLTPFCRASHCVVAVFALLSLDTPPDSPKGRDKSASVSAWCSAGWIGPLTAARTQQTGNCVKGRVFAITFYPSCVPAADRGEVQRHWRGLRIARKRGQI
jgi:hypothetical protein